MSEKEFMSVGCLVFYAVITVSHAMRVGVPSEVVEEKKDELLSFERVKRVNSAFVINMPKAEVCCITWLLGPDVFLRKSSSCLAAIFIIS